MARVKSFDQNDLLEKALQIFWKKGYDATSMQNLLEGLGISRSSFYDTFGDKRQLYLNVLAEYQRKAIENLKQLLEANPSPRKAIENLLVQTAAQAASDIECKGCFMVNAAVEEAAYDEDISRISKDNKDKIIRLFTEIIGAGQEMGEISKRFPAAQLAELVFVVNNGVQAIGKFEKDLQKLRRSVETVLALMDD